MLFQQVEHETVILVENGIFKQTELYRRGTYLFAKIAGGYVRLYADQSTSKPKCRLDCLTYSGDLYSDDLGKLATSGKPDRKISGAAQKLLAAD